jgi:hypothetical protein
MNNMSLFVSSWRGDVTRCKKLYESIEKFNEDKLPFYIVLSKNDVPVFKNVLGTEGINYIDEESINPYTGQIDGWRMQQINKINFHKLNVTENYFTLDSDCFFIKPFYIDDFIAYDNVPYTTVFEDNVYQLTSQNYEGWKDDKEREFIDLCHKAWQRDIRQTIPNSFKKALHYGPCPVTFHSKVWAYFYENYLHPNNLSILDIILHVPNEYGWYGEYLMYTKLIDIVPVEAPFLCMHSKAQYDWFIQHIPFETIKRVYMGVIINSAFYAGEENEEKLDKNGRTWQLSKSLVPVNFGGWYNELEN